MAKPIDELIALTQNDQAAAERLSCSPEFVRSWRPREHWQTKRVESGVEPSVGFISCALAILR